VWFVFIFVLFVCFALVVVAVSSFRAYFVWLVVLVTCYLVIGVSFCFMRASLLFCCVFIWVVSLYFVGWVGVGDLLGCLFAFGVW